MQLTIESNIIIMQYFHQKKIRRKMEEKIKISRKKSRNGRYRINHIKTERTDHSKL